MAFLKRWDIFPNLWNGSKYGPVTGDSESDGTQDEKDPIVLILTRRIKFLVAGLVTLLIIVIILGVRQILGASQSFQKLHSLSPSS